MMTQCKTGRFHGERPPRNLLWFVNLAAIAILIVWNSGIVSAQERRATPFGEEPSPTTLGAPLFPGAEFIRVSDTSDPYHQTALYISLVPVDRVEEYYTKRLREKRVVYYEDNDIYLTAYLLMTWSRFPQKPKRDELVLLEKEPTIQLVTYDPREFEPIARFYDNIPGGRQKATAIRNGETLIKYTYRRPEEDSSAARFVGSWMETSRDLPGVSGSRFRFNADGSYEFYLPSSGRFPGAGGGTSRQGQERPTERGRYIIAGNSITLQSDAPMDGQRVKSGLFRINRAVLSIELINKPRLSFVRIMDFRDAPRQTSTPSQFRNSLPDSSQRERFQQFRDSLPDSARREWLPLFRNPLPDSTGRGWFPLFSLPFPDSLQGQRPPQYRIPSPDSSQRQRSPQTRRQ